MLARLLRSAGMAALLAASTAFVAPSALAQKDPAATIAASGSLAVELPARPRHGLAAEELRPRQGGDDLARDRQGRVHLRRLRVAAVLCMQRTRRAASGSGPSFYTLATASVGFQAGISVSEGVTLVMTGQGLQLAARHLVQDGWRRERRRRPRRRGREERHRRGSHHVQPREGRLRRAELRRNRRHGRRRLEPAVLRQEGAPARRPGAGIRATTLRATSCARR